MIGYRLAHSATSRSKVFKYGAKSASRVDNIANFARSKVLEEQQKRTGTEVVGQLANLGIEASKICFTLDSKRIKKLQN
jgi:hypothetical protein